MSKLKLGDKTKKIIILVCVIIIIIVGGTLAIKALFPNDKKTDGPLYTTAAVERGDISVGVSAVGNLNASYGGSITIPYSNNADGSQTSYKIEKLLVKSGDLVQSGQAIMQLSAPNLGAQITSLKEQVASERKSLANLLNIKEDRVDYATADNGVTLSAPFDGKVTDLMIENADGTKQSIRVGTKIESGTTVCKVVDDAKIELLVALTASEINQITDKSKAVVRYGSDFSVYEAKIVDVNRNAVAVQSGSDDLKLDSGMAVNQDTDNKSYEFVYYVTLQAVNPGLLFPGMYASIGFYEPAAGEKFNGNIPNGTRWCRYISKISQFSKEESVISNVKGVVSKVIAKNSANIKAGEPILVISGQDVRGEIEKRLETYRQKKTQLDGLLRQQASLTVTAPSTGMVAELSKKQGDSVSAGDYVGNIFAASDMYMSVQVDDIDIVKVSVGAPVKITLDALPGQEFTGKVEYISGMGEGQSGISRFRVEVSVKGSSEMRSGMQARAYIDSGSAKDVLLIPAEAIFEEDGVSKVEVLGADNLVTVRPIEVGLLNDRQAEVRSGLEEGEIVITGSTTDLLPSQQTPGAGGGLLPTPSGDGAGDGGATTPDGGGDAATPAPPMMDGATSETVEAAPMN